MDPPPNFDMRTKPFMLETITKGDSRIRSAYSDFLTFSHAARVQLACVIFTSACIHYCTTNEQRHACQSILDLKRTSIHLVLSNCDLFGKSSSSSKLNSFRQTDH